MSDRWLFICPNCLWQDEYGIFMAAGDKFACEKCKKVFIAEINFKEYVIKRKNKK